MAQTLDARHGVAFTRLAYLYGIGNDGVPVKSHEKLLELSGVHNDTLRRHVAKWEREAEEIAKSTSDYAQGFGLSEETVESHRHDVEFLRKTADSLKNELENLPKATESLYNVLDGIRDNLALTSEDFATIARTVESYCRLSMNRQKVLSLYMATRKAWQDASAVSSMLAAGEVTMKENAKRKARQAMEDADRRAPASTDAGAAAAANTGLFRRSST